MLRMIFEIVMVLAVIGALFFMTKISAQENTQSPDEVDDTPTKP
jgi:hypothetical protein